MLKSSLRYLCILCVSVAINAGAQKPVPEPTIFSDGVISTSDYESSITVSPDNTVAYFVKSSPDLSLRVILVSHFKSGKWTTPEVASFSGEYNDTDPCFSPDGTKLYFASRRPVEGTAQKTDNDIWVVEKTNTGWNAPRHLGVPVNTESQETSPSVAADGTLYFVSNRPGGKGATDIYRAKLIDSAYSTPENAGDAINTPGPEVQVFATPDDNMLVIAALGRPDSVGSVDLYVSRRVDGAWSKPVNLGNKINSRGVDSAPRISADGKHFFWTSTRGYGFEEQQAARLAAKELSHKLRNAGNSLGDIYHIDMTALQGIK
jgi:dipeptidyl aminopeptidase/acylaminoacyl peptidase